ncbi:hypothetical protein Btru_023490 [Bulinus truncatus]|nr:hypothetical protein Btru_023490 [Bulinus truncatus]
MADIWKSVSGSLGSAVGVVTQYLPPRKVDLPIKEVVVRELQMLVISPSARLFIRIAGISGAIAVALGAYGSHVFRHKDVDPRLKETFEIASKYHFIHTLALLAVPFARRPTLTGTLMTSGLVLFCGSCYYHAMTNNMAIRKVTPYGGFLFIFAWASLVL